MKRSLLLLTVLTITGAAVGGITVSRLYWGYWLTPPDPGPTMYFLSSVDRCSAFLWDGSLRSGRSVLLDAAGQENWISGEDPMGRVAGALVRRGLLPSTSEAVPANLFAAVHRDLEQLGWLPESRPDYPYARQVVGYLALGRDPSGHATLVAALHGGQASNDHYPYYELSYRVLPHDGLQRRSGRRYWSDFAGLEGIAHWLGAFVGACVGFVGSSAFLVRDAWRRSNTRLHPSAAAGDLRKSGASAAAAAGEPQPLG